VKTTLVSGRPVRANRILLAKFRTNNAMDESALGVDREVDLQVRLEFVGWVHVSQDAVC
jgi:hypothetical protein